MYTKIPLTFCMQYKNNPILHSFSVWKQACLETCHYIIFPHDPDTLTDIGFIIEVYPYITFIMPVGRSEKIMP